MKLKAIFHVVKRDWKKFKEDLSNIEGYSKCNGTGERNLYCYNCILDNRCPYDNGA